MNRIRRFILPAVAGILALSACEPDQAITTEPVGDPAYGILLQLTPTNLPRGTARIPDPHPTDVPPTTTSTDTIQVNVAGLDSLEGASYSIWLADSLGQNIVKATGTLRVIVTDTILDQFGDPVASPDTTIFPGVSAFANGGPRHALQFTTDRAQSGMAASDLVQLVFVSVESDPGATTPSATRRPIWGRRAGGTAVRRIISIDTIAFDPDDEDVLDTDTTFVPRHRISTLSFGNFAFDPANQYVYVPAGRGRAYFRGDVMVINDSSLSRPPLGYYYAAYVVKSDDVTNLPVDTIYLGPITAPFPDREISLRHADSVLVAPEVQVLVIPPNVAGDWANPAPSAILAASTRVSADTVSALMGATGAFRGITDVFITLESKNAAEGRLGPAILLRAGVPEIVRFGED
jgi:hypothetical protein